jgi:hypothetical protein
LILGPEPGLNGLFDVLKRLGLIFALRDTAGQRQALSDDPAVFGFLECYVKQHEVPPFALSGA